MKHNHRVDGLLVTLIAVPVIPFVCFLSIAANPALYRFYDLSLAVLFAALLAGALFVSGVHILERRWQALPSALFAVVVIVVITGFLANRANDRESLALVAGEVRSGTSY